MAPDSLEIVDPSIGLAHSLDEFEQALQDFPFVDTEEREQATSAYKNTSRNSLESFLQQLNQQTGLRREGILRLASLFSLIRHRSSSLQNVVIDDIQPILFGTLKATLIAGYQISDDLTVVTAKLDALSQRTSVITGHEPKFAPDEVVQGLLIQLASILVENCGKILRLRSRAEVLAYEPTVYNIDQVCWNLEKETERARKAIREKERAKEQKRAADEKKLRDLRMWIEEMIKVEVQDKHDSIGSSHVEGTGAAFVRKVQEWLDAKEVPTLLAHGSPGVGKTYLAYAVISRHFQQPLTGVDALAYIYFTYDDRDQQTPFIVFAGIVLQLLKDSSELRTELFRLFEEQEHFPRRQKTLILKGFRRAVANLKSSVLLIFDALDEASEAMRDEILSLLEEDRSKSSRILVTSRSNYQELLLNDQVLSFRVQADADDIRAFSQESLNSRNVKRMIKAMYGTGAEAKRFASSIAEEVLRSSHGLFLHAYYATKDISEQVNIGGIKKAASKQHKDADSIYEVTLQQINDLVATKRDVAHRTIAWLTFSKKPFHENEIMEAFTVNDQTGRIDPTSQLDIENVVEYCRGLVIRVKTRKVSYLRLAHMTAHEYFSQVECFQQFREDMCLTCLSRILSCLTPAEKATGVEDIAHDKRGEMDEDLEDAEDSVDEYTVDSSESEADQEDSSESDDAAEDAKGNDDVAEESLSDDSDSQSIFEDYESWRISGTVWPKTLLPWIAIKTPFSLYAGKYALSHLADSIVTAHIESIILKLTKAAISRRRRSTFSSQSRDHPYRMNMLHMAAFIGIPSVIEEVLKVPTIHIDNKDILGRTALMWALAMGKESAAKKLLEEGAQVQVYDRRQRSTLTYASTIRNESLLEELLKNAPEEDIDANFLRSCAKADNVYLMDSALSRVGNNVDDKDETGRAPIHEAVIGGSEGTVEYLVRRGAQLSVPDLNGFTPLMYAAQGQNSNIVDILIRGGADPNPLNQKKKYPLHIAAESAKASPKILRTLLRAGAKTLVEDENGKVPLQTVIRARWSEKETLASVKLLSEDLSTISHQSHDGENALHDSVRCPFISVLKYLVSRAPPSAINAQKTSGQTPIFEALIAYNVPAFDLLIELPCINLLALRYDKKTLLNCAAWADEISVAQKLIIKEPRLIKLAEQHSVSAIQYAVERNNPAMFKLLLEAGSDPRSERNQTNADLISYAAFEGREWCIDALLGMKAWMTYNDSGQAIAHRNHVGRTLLHDAAGSGSSVVLKKILSHLPLEGLSLEDRDVLGMTPLHCAARTRNENLVTLLLEAGSDKNALTTSGESPLDLALEFEAKDTVRVLLDAGALTGQGPRLKPSKIQFYKNEDFFARLNEITTVPNSPQRNVGRADTGFRNENVVRRLGTEYDIFNEHSPDIPFLEILIPETADPPILRVIFETVSHDQGYSHESDQWGGTYEHSHTFFEAAIQKFSQQTGDTERQPSPRIRVQTNVHADSTYRTHVNIFDSMGLNQGQRDWVQSLRPGDRIQLYAKAKFPAWLNFVQKAEITLHYHEGDSSEETEEGELEDLSARVEAMKVLGQDPREHSPSNAPKVVIYHQSLHGENGILVPLRPLVKEKTGITSLIVGMLNLHSSPSEVSHTGKGDVEHGTAAIHLNEYAIDDPSLEDFWMDIQYLQGEGVQVIGMLSLYENVLLEGDETWLRSRDDVTFERCYAALHNVVAAKRLDGISLETQLLSSHASMEGAEEVLFQRVVQLTDKLHADFGPGFIIIVSATAEALLDTSKNPGGDNGSGINLRRLELQRGHLISWYNVRISDDSRHEDGNDEADTETTATATLVRTLGSYIRLLHDKIYQPHRLVLKISTSADVAADTQRNLGGPFVDSQSLFQLLNLLRWSYSPLTFGGIAGWEYAHPRDSSSTTTAHVGGNAPRPPWLWVKQASAIVKWVFSDTEHG